MIVSRRAKNSSQIGFSIADAVIKTLDLSPKPQKDDEHQYLDKAKILEDVLSILSEHPQSNLATDKAAEFESLHRNLSAMIRDEKKFRQQYINLEALAKLDRSQPGDAFVHQMLTGISRRSSVSGRLVSLQEAHTGPIKRIKRKPLSIPNRALEGVNNLTFDSFELDRHTEHRPLSVLALFLIKKEGLIEDLRLNQGKIAYYFNAIEAGYKDIPYHNRVHAADVLQRFYAIIKTVNDDVFSPEQKLTCIIAAAVHDYAHAGVTNAFLVKTRHTLAQRYNDRSPWENHHVAAAWSLLMTTDANFLENVEEESIDQIRQDVITLVLATDMTKHLKWMKRFDEDPSPLGLTDLPNKKTKAMILALKAADVGHTSCEWSVHIKWVNALQRELYAQGDLEAELGIPHTPMTDRSDVIDIRSSQISFFDVVVLPMYSLLAVYFQGTLPMLSSVQNNRDATRSRKM